MQRLGHVKLMTEASTIASDFPEEFACYVREQNSEASCQSLIIKISLKFKLWAIYIL